MQYSIFKYSNHVLHYKPMTLFYNGKFVPFGHLHLFCLSAARCLWQPPICSLYYEAVFLFLFLKFPHISEITHYLSFSDLFHLA